jgi:hypothetical protein
MKTEKKSVRREVRRTLYQAGRYAKWGDLLCAAAQLSMLASIDSRFKFLHQAVVEKLNREAADRCWFCRTRLEQPGRYCPSCGRERIPESGIPHN